MMRTTLRLLTLLLAVQILTACGCHPELEDHVQSTPQPQHSFQDAAINQRVPATKFKFKYLVFESGCYDTFFVKKDFFNVNCIKLTISKILGYVLVYGALLVKAPQILKIIMNKSTVGISFSSVVIQSLMNALMIGYNIHRGNPFSIYGENVFLGLSNLVIIGCFFAFSKKGNYHKYTRGTIMLLAVSIPLICQMFPNMVIQNSIWLGMVAFLISRLDQVLENHRNKSTGNLSFISALLNFGGNIARTFTVLTEASGDTLYLISNVLPIFVNGIIVVQFLMYWNNKASSQTVNPSKPEDVSPKTE